VLDERPDLQAHRAEVIEGGPPAEEDRDDVAKGETAMDDMGMAPGSFAADDPVRIHVQPTRLRAS
jgi:hypothetical protein